MDLKKKKMSTPNNSVTTSIELETADTSKNSWKRNVKPTVLEDDPELGSVTKVGSDTVDQGCVKCVSGDSKENKEDVSLSMSSDDEIEQAISLNINKKSNSTAYKGMMDIALLTANANQLRFLITYNSEEKTFIISATLIVLSLIIQVAVGIGMIYKRQMKKKGNGSKADKVGSLLISGIFCLAVLNVLVVSFTTTASTVKSPT